MAPTFDAKDVIASWGAGIDASNPNHVGNTGAWEYYSYLWDGLMNCRPNKSGRGQRCSWLCLGTAVSSMTPLDRRDGPALPGAAWPSRFCYPFPVECGGKRTLWRNIHFAVRSWPSP